MEDFEWRDIPGFPGYQVSNFGQVKSLERVIARRNNSPKRLRETVLKPHVSPAGHKKVVLGQMRTKQVHQLVMLAFKGPPPDGHEVLHANHNAGDNRLSNLSYGTRSQNLRHDYSTGNRAQATPVISVEKDDTKRVFETITSAGLYYGLTQPAVTRLVQTGGRSQQAKVRFEKC